MKFGRLITPVLGGMALLLILVLGGSSAISYIQLEEATLEGAEEAAQSAVRAFHRGILQELPPHDRDLAVYLEVSVSTAAPVAFTDLRHDREELERLIFVSPRGRPIGQALDDAPPIISPAWLRLIEGGTRASAHIDGAVVVFVPLRRRDRLLGGTLAIYDDDRLVTAQGEILQRTLSLFIGMMLAGAALGLLMARRLTRPFGQLTGAIQQLTEGDLDAHVPLVDRRDELGTIASGVAALRDEVRARIHEIASREAEQRAILLSVHEGVVAVDAAGCISTINPAAERLLAKVADVSIGAPFARVIDALEPVFRPSQPDGAVFQAGARLLLMTSAPLVGRDARGEVWVLRDITREEELSEMLGHAQKMDAIGRLAGGIAHDFNNVLTGVVGAAELARRRLEPENSVQSQLALIIRAAERAAAVNEKLLTFSRKDPHTRRLVDVHDVIQDTITLFRLGTRAEITIEVDAGATRSLAEVNVSELQSALLNLCVNAADAMPEGGTLRFQTWDATDERLGLRVADTGVGIPAEVRERIFEPYFTTKREGKGTGLGLAAVYGTIESHDGTIEVHSVVGEGTAFTIFLPRRPESSRHLQRTAGLAPGRILVIDDDVQIRDLAASALAEQGFEVLCAADGVEGLAMFAQERGRLQAVVLDWIMPGLSGETVLARITCADPTQVVIVSSGFTGAFDEPALRAAGAAALVRKPYGPIEMTNSILEHALPGVGVIEPTT